MTILFRSTWALSHNFRLFGDSVFTFISDWLNSQTFSGKQQHASILVAGTPIYHAEILHRLRTVGMAIFSRADFSTFSPQPKRPHVAIVYSAVHIPAVHS